MIREISISDIGAMSEIDLSKAIFGSSSSNNFNANNTGGVKIGSGYSSGYVSSASSVRYGTCQTDSLNGSVTVLMDGSDETMVVSTNETLHVGDRVSVVSSNGSYKAIALGDGTVGGNMITVDETFTNKLTASEAFIEKLTASTAFITNLTANSAFIQYLTANDAFISGLTANKALIDNLSASKALIDNLTASTAFIDSLTASTALIEKLTGNEAFISSIASSEVLTDNLSAKYVQTDKANIDKAWIDDLFVQGSFVSQEGTLFNLTGLHINAGDITTGTLVVDRIAVKSEEDGEYYMLTPNPDGGFTQVKLDGNIIEKDSINADRILANSITTEQITTNNLVGTGGWINLANGTFHYSNAETGGYISWDGSKLDMNVNTLAIGGLASATKNDVDIVSNVANNAFTAATQAQEAANQNAIDLTNAITNFNQDITAIQTQVDGSIMTWFYDGIPTSSNEPAINWTSEADKNVHLGDLYYDNLTGYCYRWMLSGSTYLWSRVTDSDVTKALQNATLAKDVADQKRRVFYVTPVPPYDRGDLWVQGDSGDIMRCDVPKTSSQSYAALDWVKASKYTDDTIASEANTKATTAIQDASTAKTNAAQAIQDAADAAKVATNYLEYSSSGLMVGNKTSGTWSGYRTLISSSGVDYLNGSGTSVSNFSNTARIGTTSASNAYVNSSGFYVRYGTNTLASFEGNNIELGRSVTEYVEDTFYPAVRSDAKISIFEDLVLRCYDSSGSIGSFIETELFASMGANSFKIFKASSNIPTQSSEVGKNCYIDLDTDYITLVGTNATKSVRFSSNGDLQRNTLPWHPLTAITISNNSSFYPSASNTKITANSIVFESDPDSILSVYSGMVKVSGKDKILKISANAVIYNMDSAQNAGFGIAVGTSTSLSNMTQLNNCLSTCATAGVQASSGTNWLTAVGSDAGFMSVSVPPTYYRTTTTTTYVCMFCRTTGGGGTINSYSYSEGDCAKLTVEVM